MKRACKSCKRISEEKTCPKCESPTSQRWTGYLGITDPEKSEIAQSMGIKLPGEYALKVR